MDPRESSIPCEPAELGDPDITGFGVLISFLGSIAFVIVAIIWAYFKDALPRSCYNEFDYFILGREPREDDGDRVQAFQSFILSLSDQQLIAGLALAIAQMVIRFGIMDLDNKVTTYAWANAVMLAYFSCIVHLATIAVLRDYLQSRGALRHVRVILMLIIFALLIYPLVFAWDVDTSVTLRCAIANKEHIVELNSQYLGSATTFADNIEDAGTVLGLFMLLWILIHGYGGRILQLYSPGLLRQWIVMFMSKRLGCLPPRENDLIRAKEEFAERPTGRSLRLLFKIIPESMSRSFMFEILWLLFYFMFGFSQVMYYLTVSVDGIGKSKVSFEPSFGQLLPVIQLVLPFLAMAEGYSDLDKARKNPSAPRSNPSTSLISRVAEMDGKERLMRACSWLFIVIYFLCCIFISLAVSNVFAEKMHEGQPGLMIIYAFAVAATWTVISVSLSMSLLKSEIQLVPV